MVLVVVVVVLPPLATCEVGALRNASSMCHPLWETGKCVLQ